MILQPIPLSDLLRRMRREVETSGAIFDLPVRKWFHPQPGFEFGAVHFGRRTATPVGPAAGPHTQLAQNIVLSWLAGSRILELKTVQVDDRLDIPRPCIHVPNVGYNVEWSQELRVRESLVEYAKAAYLIEVLRSTRCFGAFAEEDAFDRTCDTVFDISVGYDLEGIRSEKVTGFLHFMRDAGTVLDELRGELGGDLSSYRDLDLSPAISDCVTLSTFHGCPADQIESICRYLIEDLGLHVIVKLNPTLLGFERVRELLHDRLGYTRLELRREAFDIDLQYPQALEILSRLRAVASSRGTSIGAKFTNTLVVANDPAFFPTQKDPYMYLSGQPLHVISMNLMQRIREDIGFELPVSFSAGIDAKNFPDAVACGMVPVTTCTDLLRQGSYGRLPRYLKNLKAAMERAKVTSREAFVLAVYGRGAEAFREALSALPQGRGALRELESTLTKCAEETPDLLPARAREEAPGAGIDGEELVLLATRIAGRLNGREIVPKLEGNVRYHARFNSQDPKRIESRLGLYDCINCDLCIPACPNDAVFAYEVEPLAAETELLAGGEEGLARSPGSGYGMRESHQLAVFESACNECSNCEVFCPEEGAPFREKELLFSSRDAFEESDLDGFFREGKLLYSRIGGRVLVAETARDGSRARVSGDGVALEVELDPLRVSSGDLSSPKTRVDTADLLRIRTVWRHVYQSARPNPVNPEPLPRGEDS